jgi:hypothetical protein
MLSDYYSGGQLMKRRSPGKMRSEALEFIVDAKNSFLENPQNYLEFNHAWRQVVAQLSEAEARELLTAIHEAGHAVMSWLVDQRFEYVTIIPDGDEDSFGHLLHAPFPQHLLRDIESGFPCRASELYMDQRMIISLAGYAAETHHLEPEKPDSEQSRSDLENAFEMTIYRFASIEDQTKYVDEMAESAKGSMLNFYTHVMVLAIELLQKKKIGYDEVLSLLVSVREE